MKKSDHKILARDKRKLQKRLARKFWSDQSQPMFGPAPIRYEMGDRSRAIGFGGIGAIHTMVHQLGLADAINMCLTSNPTTCSTSPTM